MEPLDYVRSLRRRWAIVLAATLLGAAVGWLTAPVGAVTTSTARPVGGTYEATQNLMVDRQVTSGSRGSNRYSQTTNLPLLAVLATSGEVPLRVVERLGLKTSPAAVAAKVKVEAEDKLGTLRVSSNGSSPDEVAALVDAYSAEILRLASDRNQALHNEAITRAKATTDSQQVRLRHLDARLLQLPPGSSESRLLTAERDALLKVYAEQQAVLQDLQSQPPASPGLVSLGPAVPIPMGSGELSGGTAMQFLGGTRARTGLGTLLGFALGCALALLIDRVDTRVRGRREAEQAFGLPVVGELPRTRPLSARAPEFGGTFGVDPETADAYGRLGLAVLHSPRWVLSPRPPTIAHDDEEDGAAPVRLIEGPTRFVLVASPGREDARAAVVANLAASLAAAGRSVIAIDCDPERPRLAELLGVRGTETAEPISNGVAGHLGVRPSAVRGVWVVMPGASRGADLAVDGQIMRSYLEWGDIVLVDAGPILSGGEAGAWAVEADAVLIVTGIARTTAETAALTHEHLARLKARVLGVALVDGVAGTIRSRPRGAPPLPPGPPPMSSGRTAGETTGVPSGSRGVRSDSPPATSQQQVERSFQAPAGSSAAASPHAEATAHRLRQGEVAQGDWHRNGDSRAPTSAQPRSSRTDPGERIAPVIEVLAPEPSTSIAGRSAPRRSDGERTASVGLPWSVSRPWPWATGDRPEDPKAGGASSTGNGTTTSSLKDPSGGRT